MKSSFCLSSDIYLCVRSDFNLFFFWTDFGFGLKLRPLRILSAHVGERALPQRLNYKVYVCLKEEKIAAGTATTVGYQDIYKAVPEKKKKVAGKRNRPGRGGRKRHKERVAAEWN